MATEQEIAQALNVTERELKKTDALLKQITDVHAPKGLKQVLRNLRSKAREKREQLEAKSKSLRERLRRKRAGGAQKAISWAKSQNGVTESPANSNWGPKVSDWIKFTGYGSPVPWCGCFACYAVVKIGGANVPARIRLGYSGYINDDARANRNGLRAVPKEQAQAGDIFTIGNSHIGLVTGPASNGAIPTVEGNTSPSSSGSQYNGGAVAIKSRALSIVTTVARPAY